LDSFGSELILSWNVTEPHLVNFTTKTMIKLTCAYFHLLFILFANEHGFSINLMQFAVFMKYNLVTVVEIRNLLDTSRNRKKCW
jgi:hypothetical protein